MRPLPLRSAALSFCLGCLAALAAGCAKEATTPRTWIDERTTRPFIADDERLVPRRARSVVFGDALRLLGVKLPPEARAGDTVDVTLFLLVERDVIGRRPRILVRGRVAGGDVDAVTVDHDAVGGRVAPLEWTPGDLLVDRFRLALPPTLHGDVDVYVGIGDGAVRFRTSPAARGDLVHVGTVRIADPQPPALARVPRARGALVVDGVLDEPDWERAAALPLRHYLDRGAITRPTTALLLWSDDALWLAFRTVDPDPYTPYTKDDDPLYEAEALEIFIDADGDGDDYVELQAAPNDLHFDAAFRGGRRKGMDVSFHHPYVTKSVVGTVELEGRRAPGLTQEWRIPFAGLPDVPTGEPRAGARWRINLFRLERLRSGGVVRGTEGSAWSPPMTGDFHNLARFGVVEFVEGDATANAAATSADRR